MDTPKTLNTILNIIIFLIVFSIAVGILLTILTLTGVSYDFIESETLITYKENTPAIYFFMVMTLCVYVIFVFGLFRLKKAAYLFMNNNLYSPELGKNTNISGKCMVITGVFWWFLDGFSAIFFGKSVSLAVSDKTFIYFSLPSDCL